MSDIELTNLRRDRIGFIFQVLQPLPAAKHHRERQFPPDAQVR